MAVEKVKIKDRLYDVISYEEYTRHPDSYGKFNAVKDGEYVYPIKGRNDTGVGLYDNDDTTVEFVKPITEEDKDSYSVDHIISISNCKNIREVIEAQQKLKESERAILTKADNITFVKIGANDTPHMAALKEAINGKQIDLANYEYKFGTNYNNDMRLLSKPDITMNKLKSFLNKLDLKASIVIEDASDDVPNPLGRKIVSTIISGDDYDDEDD